MQPVKLELLAPAKNKDIGIAAIDCGADAVYIAGPGFGARAAAGNPVGDIALLTAYAHKFSAKIYAAVNTIIYEDELRQVKRMIWELFDAGVDALIVQDLGITRIELPPIELHASTQCAIRTPEKARLLEDLGFRRLILERQMSFDEIRRIREAVDCELEFFVHGAICVCYSGNCYLSQYLAGRSANRGACIQACRSLYDVVDGEGNVLVHNRSILSPKDYCLDNRIEDLADAGICSFKIEGRLKGDGYVKNLCRHYRNRLDELFLRRPGDYKPASSGTLEGGFTPNPDATFNRGYTQLFIDGRRSRWNSPESTKSIGEYIGTVASLGKTVVIDSGKALSNGDGLVFVGRGGIAGMRADVVNGNQVTVKDVTGISPGDKVYRNYNIRFEHELQVNVPRRKIEVKVVFGQDEVVAVDQNGFRAAVALPADAPVADKPEAAAENIRRNMGKRTGHFDFECTSLEQSPVRFYPAATLNALRRDLAAELEKARISRFTRPRAATVSLRQVPASDFATGIEVESGRNVADYTANCANSLAKEVLEGCGFETVEPAYELKPVPDAELMRSRYCVKYELGLCPELRSANRVEGPLYLVNAGKRLRLQFDCKNCEMIVTLP
ncbi:MAG: U32 family peptidase [Bacteroidales bacterium]|nr:U32 family peptidase [Bacteroidales bacterium]